ncbi:hypothetical protein GCM10025867_05590 [Frondihabitans sucicola]|uniref:Solute-binding protein family 5 domain-containing protein n=1 Tax=Frondihabitans sucicola TaxID=1268041 RepID=A0ABM8GIY5_9MICO|nr:hypothetical protein GCM10025867_05590 [Frondihabitans sucicola]
MSRFRLKAAAAASLIAASALVLTGCAGSSGSSGSPKGSASRAITIGQVTEPEKAPDPIVDGSLAGYNYYYNEFDQLTKLTASGAVKPSLATKWTHSADFTTWTFTIRKGVKFTDGSDLTAADVAFTYDTILKTPDSDNLAYMGALKSVAATGPDTVEFTLNASYSPWPSITTAISIVPQKVYQKLGSAGFAKAPVGSGPYEFVSWNRGVDYVMKRNPHYWGTKPQIAKVTFQTVADEDARLNGVSSGSLDLALISPNQVDTLAGNSAVDVASRAANG